MNQAILREKLQKGDRVFVVMKITPTHTKRKPAEVLVVMRGAAKVRLEESGRETVVNYSEMEYSAEVLARLESKPKETPVPRLVSVPTPVPPPPRREPEQRTSRGDVPAAVPPSSSLDAWLDMGREIEQELAEKIAGIVMERRALSEEKKAIEKREDELQAEFQDLSAKQDAIRKIVGR